MMNMGKKIKKNWQKIAIIGVSSYVGLTVLSSLLGYSFINKQKKAIKNHETEIGREFVKRKTDFHDRFYKNFNGKLDRLGSQFAASEKRSDQSQIDDMKEVISSIEKDRGNKSLQELEERNQQVSLMQAAFNKKWESQSVNESSEQFEKRKDEGKVDWLEAQVRRREAGLKWYSQEDLQEVIKRDILVRTESLNLEKARFKEKWEADDPFAID